jgi:hypothetical protein
VKRGINVNRLCGFLFLFILLTTMLSKSMAGAPLDPEDVSNTFGAVTEGGKRFRLSVVLDLVSHVSVVALAGALYPAFSPHNRSLALLGTLWRVAEGTIIAFTELNNVVLLAVAQKFVSATGAEAVALEAIGRTLILAEDWGYKIGLAFFALGWLMYGILFVSTGAVPPVLGWWAVVASLLAVVGRWLALVSPDVGLVAISFVPIMLFEVVFGVWLLFQGGQIGPP